MWSLTLISNLDILDIHVVEDDGKDCVGHNSNKDSDRQGPRF